MVWLGRSHYRLAPLPESDDCSPSRPGSSGNGALANVAFDRRCATTFRLCSARARKPTKDAHHQPSVPYEVRDAVTNTSPDHRQPGPTTPRSTRASAPDQLQPSRRRVGDTTRRLNASKRRPGRRAGPQADPRLEL